MEMTGGDSAKGSYDMILRRYLLTELGPKIKVYDHVIESKNGPFKGSAAPMVDLGTCEFKHFNAGEITPK